MDAIDRRLAGKKFFDFKSCEAQLNNCCLTFQLGQPWAGEQETLDKILIGDKVKLIIGVSGSGKTRKALDLLAVNIGYYFVMDTTFSIGSRDLSDCLAAAISKVESTDICIELLKSIRCGVINWLMKNGVTSPLQLLLAQIYPNEVFGRDIYHDLFQNLWSVVSKEAAFSAEGCEPISKICVIDEIQAGLRKKHKFDITSDTERSFITPLVKNFVCDFTKLVLTGTGIQYNVLKAVVSSKAAGCQSNIEELNNFKLMTAPDIYKFALTVLSTKLGIAIDDSEGGQGDDIEDLPVGEDDLQEQEGGETKDPSVEETLSDAKSKLNVVKMVKYVARIISEYPDLVGRPRLSAFVIDKVVEKLCSLQIDEVSTMIGDICDECIGAQLHSSKTSFPLRFAWEYKEEWEKFVVDRVVLNTWLSRAVVNFLLFGSWEVSVSEDDSLSLVEYGVGFRHLEGKKYRFDVIEPMIAKAIMILVDLKDVVVEMLDMVEKQPAKSASGLWFDYVVAMACFMKYSKGSDLKGIIYDLDFYAQKPDRNFICLPDVYAGPDIVYWDGEQFIIIQVKYKKKMTARAQGNAATTTDPTCFYTLRDSKSKKPIRGYTTLHRKVKKHFLNKRIKRLLVYHTDADTRYHTSNNPDVEYITNKNDQDDFFGPFFGDESIMKSRDGSYVWDLLKDLDVKFDEKQPTSVEVYKAGTAQPSQSSSSQSKPQG